MSTVVVATSLMHFYRFRKGVFIGPNVLINLLRLCANVLHQSTSYRTSIKCGNTADGRLNPSLFVRKSVDRSYNPSIQETCITKKSRVKTTKLVVTS